jgi:hypothetical protein
MPAVVIACLSTELDIPPSQHVFIGCTSDRCSSCFLLSFHLLLLLLIYYYFIIIIIIYLLQLGFHPVAVVLTLVHTIQMDI